jgi:hypothetical protein
VNGISLLGSSHLDAVKALRSSPDRISITVCQGYDPKDLMKKVEAEAAANGRAERSTYYNKIAGKKSNFTPFCVVCVCAVPLSAASSLALDDALNRLLSESMDSLNLPQKSQSAIAPAGVSKYIEQLPALQRIYGCTIMSFSLSFLVIPVCSW